MNPSAFDHYHARYDNTSYARVQAAVVRDVFGEEVALNPVKHWAALAQEPAHTILNTVIDACLEISGVDDCHCSINKIKHFRRVFSRFDKLALATGHQTKVRTENSGHRVFER